jgi:hypothetical protein
MDLIITNRIGIENEKMVEAPGYIFTKSHNISVIAQGRLNLITVFLRLNHDQ